MALRSDKTCKLSSALPSLSAGKVECGQYRAKRPLRKRCVMRRKHRSRRQRRLLRQPTDAGFQLSRRFLQEHECTAPAQDCAVALVAGKKKRTCLLRQVDCSCPKINCNGQCGTCTKSPPKLRPHATTVPWRKSSCSQESLE